MCDVSRRRWLMCRHTAVTYVRRLFRGRGGREKRREGEGRKKKEKRRKEEEEEEEKKGEKSPFLSRISLDAVSFLFSPFFLFVP